MKKNDIIFVVMLFIFLVSFYLFVISNQTDFIKLMALISGISSACVILNPMEL